LRDDDEQFRLRGAQVIAIAPHPLDEVESLVSSLRLPFPIGSDPDRSIYRVYGVASRPWSLGQKPGLVVIDRLGWIRWLYIGWQQWDLPTNADVFTVLDRLALEADSSKSGDRRHDDEESSKR
jgi:peroxiredoxin